MVLMMVLMELIVVLKMVVLDDDSGLFPCLIAISPFNSIFIDRKTEVCFSEQVLAIL